MQADLFNQLLVDDIGSHMVIIEFKRCMSLREKIGEEEGGEKEQEQVDDDEEEAEEEERSKGKDRRVFTIPFYLHV